MVWKTVKGRRCKPTRFPGVMQLQDGRMWIRARAKSPKTGELVEVNRVLDDHSPSAASDALQARLQEIRAGEPERKQRPRFSSYSASFLEAKIAAGEVQSAASKKLWVLILRRQPMVYACRGRCLLPALNNADATQGGAAPETALPLQGHDGTATCLT